MKVTMKDIAVKAGVSQSAVSAVLNGTTASRVSKEKRELILKISRELNYQRNFAAIALKKQETKVLGLICNDLHSPYFSELTTAITNTAYRNGYRLMLNLMPEKVDLDIEYFNRIVSNMCDGIIICREINDENIKNVIHNTQKMNKVPFVVLGSLLDNLSSVSYDYDAGMQKAFNELLEKGHRKIAFAGHNSDINKLNAYRKCCTEYDIKATEYFIKSDHEVKSAFECGQNIVSARDAQSALICTDYSFSLIYPGIHAAGLTIPDDMSVIAFNNTRLSSCFVPALTSVSLDPEILARYIIDALLEQINAGNRKQSPKVKNVVVTPELIIRDSVAAYQP